MSRANLLRWPTLSVHSVFALPLLGVLIVDCATKWMAQTQTSEKIVLWGGRLLITPPIFNRGMAKYPGLSGIPYALYLLIACTLVTLAFICAWYLWPNRWTWVTVVGLLLFEGATIAEAMHVHEWIWVRAGMMGRLTGMFILAWDWHRQTTRDNWQTMAALGLFAGGMLGNLWDVLRWNGGVPDFVIIKLGIFRLGSFNVADVGILSGSLWLIWQLARRTRATKAS